MFYYFRNYNIYALIYTKLQKKYTYTWNKQIICLL